MKNMKGKVPDYRVSTVVSDPDTGEDRWTSVGVGFEGDTSITVLMDAIPVNGKIILQRPKNKAQ